MKLENWKTNIAKVENWMQTQDDGIKMALESIIELGNHKSTDDEGRTAFWGSIRNIGSRLEGFPSARVGRESALSSTAQVNVATVAQTVENAFASIGEEYHGVLLSVVVPHGRTGGVYANWSAFCQEMSKKAGSYMMDSIKEKRWDGEEMNGEIPVITPTLTKAERDALEASNEEVAQEE